MQLLVVAILALVACTLAAPNVVELEIEEDAQYLVDMLETKEDLIDFITQSDHDDDHIPKLKDFTYKDCGGASAMVTINSVALTPDPLAFPGPLNVAAAFKINKDVSSTLTGDVTIYKEVLGKYIKLPCIDNFGSCTYNNLCDLLEQVQCPVPIVKIGIDCRCPLKANSYSLPKTEFDIQASIIPTGGYHIIGNATMNGVEAACLDIMFTVE